MLLRGLLSGRLTSDTTLAADDFRSRGPRFSGANLQHNLGLVEALRTVATELRATPALAWALHRGTDVVPLVGARRRDRLAEAMAALELTLDESQLARLEAAVPANAVAGDRYDTHGMRMLDSEADNSA